MMLLGPQINYMPDESHVIVLVSLRCENSRVPLLVSFVLCIIPGWRVLPVSFSEIFSGQPAPVSLSNRVILTPAQYPKNSQKELDT